MNAGLVHLLADAVAHTAGEDGYPWPELLCGLGCLVTHCFEALAESMMSPPAPRQCAPTQQAPPQVLGQVAEFRRSPDGEETAEDSVLVGSNAPPLGTRIPVDEVAKVRVVPERRRSLLTAPLLMIALSFHSLLEGLSLGAAGASTALHLFLAILAHKGVAAFSLGVTWLPGSSCNVAHDSKDAQRKKDWKSARQYAGAMTWFAAVTPLAVMLGISMEGSMVGSRVTAVSAGTFLYIGLVETCPGVHKSWLPGPGAVLQLAAYTGGFGCMAVLAAWT